MASASTSLARTKRRSQSSPELMMVGDEQQIRSRESVTRSLDLSPAEEVEIHKKIKNTEKEEKEYVNVGASGSKPIPVDAAVTLIDSSSSSGVSATESFSNKSMNSLKKKQNGCHIQNGAFAYKEADLITVNYDSSDDSGDDSNKNCQNKRSRFDQWTNKFRTLFRGKDKDSLDDKENRVQEASDSDDEINCSEYDKCRDRRSRSQSFYGYFRKCVRTRDEGDKPIPPSAKTKTNKSTFPATFFPKRNRSRSRSKKSKQSLSQPPDSRKSEKQSKSDGKNFDSTANSNGHFALTPIEQAELLDTGLPLPAGTAETQGVEVPLDSEAPNNTIVTQDLYGQFGSHTQNGYIPRTVHTQIDYIHCLVPQLKSILDKPCYWGKIDRYQADALLENKPEGTYLLRDSAQEEFLFSVSFRRYGRSLHARLEQWSHRFSFDAHDPGVYSSDTVTGLLEHYKDPNCCMFFEPMLLTPLPRPNPHSLKALCRGVVCSNITYDDIHCLKIPQMFKEYLREYHYKQRVRVRRFEIDYLPQQSSNRRQTVTNTCISY